MLITCPVCGYSHPRITESNEQIAQRIAEKIEKTKNVPPELVYDIYQFMAFWASHRIIRDLILIDKEQAKELEERASYQFKKYTYGNLVLMEAVTNQGYSLNSFYLTWN